MLAYLEEWKQLIQELSVHGRQSPQFLGTMLDEHLLNMVTETIIDFFFKQLKKALVSAKNTWRICSQLME